MTQLPNPAITQSPNYPITRFFALFYLVVDRFIERRGPYREEHLRLVRDLHGLGEIVMAGALGEPDGGLLVFRNQGMAERFAEDDPYVLNGLVVRWFVRPWNVVAGPEPAASLPETGGPSPG
jgi:uncharacterized protein YciI